MNNNDIDKFMLGETQDEALRLPDFDELLNQMWKQMNSKYPLFSLGVGLEGEMWITEEERENHMHIIGSTGEGKSKFLEHMIFHDLTVLAKEAK